MCALTTPYEVVLKHAETIPDQTALAFGDARWSYADLAEQAGRAVWSGIVSACLSTTSYGVVTAHFLSAAALAECSGVAAGRRTAQGTCLRCRYSRRSPLA